MQYKQHTLAILWRMLVVNTIVTIAIAPLPTGLTSQFTWPLEVVANIAGVVCCGEVCGGCIASLSIGERWRSTTVTD